MSRARLAISAADLRAPDLLDRFRAAARGWSRALFDVETGGFRQSEAIGANLLATSDVVWIRHALGERDLGAPDPEAVKAFLRGVQDSATGAVRHDPGPGGQGHGAGHAFWQGTRALCLLGSDWPRAPKALASLRAPPALVRWFRARDWRPGGTGHHHEVLGLVPLVASARDAALSETLLREIAAQQDPETGTWPRGAPGLDVSRTFAYTAIQLAAGRLPDHAARIVDAVLDARRGNDLWDLERPHFHTMDAAYLLVRLPPRTGHREAESRAALAALGEATRALLGRARDRDAYASNPHAVLALTHTLGLLQEAFPDAFPSTPRYRFDWDVLDQYRSPTLGSA